MSNEKATRSTDDSNVTEAGVDKEEASIEPTRDQTAVLVDLAAKYSRMKNATCAMAEADSTIPVSRRTGLRVGALHPRRGSSTALTSSPWKPSS